MLTVFPDQMQPKAIQESLTYLSAVLQYKAECILMWWLMLKENRHDSLFPH